MAEIVGLFPTPLMRAAGVVDSAAVAGLVAHLSDLPRRDNSSAGGLSHTTMLRPSDSPLLLQLASELTPHMMAFGELLFGEALGWSVKEMWVNVMETGGHQATHNHANSFLSGVLYLTTTHPDACTVFMKAPGGADFAFRNVHQGSTLGAYNADKWISPPPQPGDLVLFPSYLMHAVPPNPGPRRITLSFNAIPTRLDSWGYTVGFSG